jgi:hypothetical protein
MATTALARHNPSSSVLKKWAAGLTNLKSGVARANVRAETVVGNVVRTVEIQSAAFAMGALQGASYDPNDPQTKAGPRIAGVPTELAVGGGLYLLSMIGLGGKHSHHLHSFGDGAIAAYVANIGRGWGYKWQRERQAVKSLPATKGESLKDQVNAILEQSAP